MLVPKGGSLTVSYPVSPETGMPNSPAAVTQKVLDAGAAGGGASYRLMQSDETFHIVPAQAKNRLGSMEAKRSLLDARIYLPTQERDGLEMLEAICGAISQAEGVSVDVGTVPMGLLRGVRATQYASNQTAREVLMETLTATGKKLSWRLLNDPEDGSYALNVHVAPSQPSAAR